MDVWREKFWHFDGHSSYPPVQLLCAGSELQIREGLKKIWNFQYFSGVVGLQKVISHEIKNKNMPT